MINEQKKQLRSFISLKKKQFTNTELKMWSSSLLNKLETHPLFIKANAILLYHSLPDEVHTHEFIERWSLTKKIYLPVIIGHDLELKLYSGKQNMKKGSYGIKEPDGATETNLSKIELALIPGMSFDPNGHRLGRGKGYYDRLLPRLSSYNIGICFDFQISTAIPHDTLDYIMDEVWTERGCITFHKTI